MDGSCTRPSRSDALMELSPRAADAEQFSASVWCPSVHLRNRAGLLRQITRYREDTMLSGPRATCLAPTAWPASAPLALSGGCCTPPLHVDQWADLGLPACKVACRHTAHAHPWALRCVHHRSLPPLRLPPCWNDGAGLWPCPASPMAIFSRADRHLPAAAGQIPLVISRLFPALLRLSPPARLFAAIASYSGELAYAHSRESAGTSTGPSGMPAPVIQARSATGSRPSAVAASRLVSMARSPVRAQCLGISMTPTKGPAECWLPSRRERLMSGCGLSAFTRADRNRSRR